MLPEAEDRLIVAAAARVRNLALVDDREEWVELFGAIWLSVMEVAYRVQYAELLGGQKGIIQDIIRQLLRGTLKATATLRLINNQATIWAAEDPETVRNAALLIAAGQVLPAISTGEHVAGMVVNQLVGGGQILPGQVSPANRVIKTWQTVGDSKVRDWHVAANGQDRPIEDLFAVGPDLLMYPRDPAGSAGNVINCRCSNPKTIVQSTAPPASPAALFQAGVLGSG